MITVTFLILLLQTSGTAPAQEMTTGGWIFMAGAWACILSLVYFAFSKVLRRTKK